MRYKMKNEKSLAERYTRLRIIAQNFLFRGETNWEDELFIYYALFEIFNGRDAEAALGIKAKKGEQRSLYARNKEDRKQMAMVWMKNHTSKERGEFGLTAKKAAEEFCDAWPNLFSVDTLLRYWNLHKNNSETEFRLNSI